MTDPQAASEAWAHEPSDIVPAPLPETSQPPRPWGTPPPSAPFSAEGLALISADLTARAWTLLHDHDAPTALELRADSDLARIAATHRSDAAQKTVRAATGIGKRELDIRASAWERHGEVGVLALLHPETVERVDPTTQRRLVRLDGTDHWVTFHKIRGRWEAV